MISRKIPESIRLFDIAANLSDGRFQGKYYKKKHHGNDIQLVLRRAAQYGVQNFLLAGGNLPDSRKNFQISQNYSSCFFTVGVHPCRANTVNSQTYFQQMFQLIQQAGSKCIAIGQCGLDYDRLQYSPKQTQLQVFPPHFDLAQRTGLPMYLHSRNTNGEFQQMVRENRHKFSSGVVHSFTGDPEQLQALLEMDLFIGVNGCSLKTNENVEVVRMIPVDKMMLETDCPYCQIRNSSAASGFVKTRFQFKNKEKYSPDFLVRGRNQPCTMMQEINRQVLEAVAAIKGIGEEELANITYQNSCSLFRIS